MTLAHAAGALAVLVTAGVTAFIPAAAPVIVPAIITAGPAYLALRKNGKTVEATGAATATALARLEGKVDGIDGKVDGLTDDVREVFGWQAVHEKLHEWERDARR